MPFPQYNTQPKPNELWSKSVTPNGVAMLTITHKRTSMNEGTLAIDLLSPKKVTVNGPSSNTVTCRFFTPRGFSDNDCKIVSLGLKV